MTAKPKWLVRELKLLALHYILFVREEDFYEELKRLEAPTDCPFIGSSRSDATTWFLRTPDGERHLAIVCMKPNSSPCLEDMYALLVHEAVHIWQEHCKLIGEDNPGDEDEAYSIQWIAGELMKSYKEQVE